MTTDPIQALSEKLDKEFKPPCPMPVRTLIYGKTDVEAQRTYYLHVKFFHVDVHLDETAPELYYYTKVKPETTVPTEDQIDQDAVELVRRFRRASTNNSQDLECGEPLR